MFSVEPNRSVSVARFVAIENTQGRAVCHHYLRIHSTNGDTVSVKTYRKVIPNGKASIINSPINVTREIIVSSVVERIVNVITIERSERNIVVFMRDTRYYLDIILIRIRHGILCRHNSRDVAVLI